MILTIFQLLIASGTALLVKTSYEKMGVSRQLHYMNMKVEEVVRFENLAIFIGVSLIILSVVSFVKLYKAGKLLALGSIVLLVNTLLFSFYILRSDASSEVAYYYVTLLMLIFTGMQFFKVFFGKNFTLNEGSLKYKVINSVFLLLTLLIFK